MRALHSDLEKVQKSEVVEILVNFNSLLYCKT